MEYNKQKFGIGTNRINFQKTSNNLKISNLLNTHVNSFRKFLSEGIDEIFNEIYPISSKKLTVEFLETNLSVENLGKKEKLIVEEYPKSYPQMFQEAMDKGSNFNFKLTAKFRIIDNETGTKKDESEVFIGNIPYLTPDGSFIVNGSERVIISQIIRAPGVYFENMKASRAHSTSDSAVFKLSTIIPSRGAWIEFDYKDYKLLGLDSTDVKLKIDKSKRISLSLFLYALGLDDAKIFNLFGDHELLVNTLNKIDAKKKDFLTARQIIFRTLNPGDRVTADSSNYWLSNLFFNRKRYNLSETGRYKINEKLSPYRRIVNQIAAEDIKDISGQVIVSKNKMITHELATKVNELYYSKKLPLTNYEVDENIFGLMKDNLNTDKLKKEFSQVSIIKVYSNLENNKRTEASKVSNVMLNCPTNYNFLTISDILATIGHILNLEDNLATYDDIDSLSNRMIRTINDLLKNQLRIGLTRMERNILEKIKAKDISGITVKSITNNKLMEMSIKDFFNSSQLSQFMDQSNPLAEISNKRRITSLGPGGLSRDTASLVVRGIHDTHYGRICPIETPEGPNIGLILNQSIYSRVNKYGLLETPYFKVENKKIINKPIYLIASEEDKKIIAPATVKITNGEIVDKNIIARYNGDFISVKSDDVDYIDVSPKQTVSIATAHIPFLENDDANRALMGANMQRQAVPLLKSEAPIVATGIEEYSGKYAPTTLKTDIDGEVIEVSSFKIVVLGDQRKTFHLKKFVRSNQGTSINQIPRVQVGQKVKKGQVIADGPSVDNGELAIGKNVVVAFTTWRGYNYEDAIIVSERLVMDDVYTSIHIEEHIIEQRTTKLGEEIITPEIPNASKESLRNLGEDGIITIGSKVKVGDVLVGKITPKSEDDVSAAEKLLDSLLGNKVKNTRDSSLRVPYSAEGIVQDVKILSREQGDKLNDGVEKIVKIYITQKRKISEGDKMSGRHGNKGVVSKILPVEDMPYLEDGTPVDIMLNPLGVPSRMNVGQVLEIHLGMAAKKLGVKVSTPIFDGATQEDINNMFKEANMTQDGKFTLVDGISGQKFDDKVAVGVMYMLKLSHMIDDKMHARSIGPYSLITQQPLRGKSNNGGQRFGEMEAWAVEAYGASNLLQEMITLKSDDIKGRNELYNAIAKGFKLPKPSIPEGFWVLFYEMRGLGLKLDFLDFNNEEIEIDNSI